MVDLGTIRSALLDLYEHRQHSQALAKALGMTPIPNPVNLAGGNSQLSEFLSGRISELYRIGEAKLGTVQAGLYVAFADEWFERSADREPYRRRVANALVRYQTVDSRWLCILMDHSGRFSEAEFVMPRRREGASPSTTRSLVNLRDPSRFHLELIAGLDISGLRDIRSVAQRWNQSFSVEAVTSRFHREFRELRDRLVDALVACNPDNPAIAGHDRTKDKTFELQLLAFGTRQLGRLLFLWFLQQKRWLGAPPGEGSTTYLLDLFRQHAGGGDGFFNDVLVPIFFDGLGLPVTSNNANPRRRAVIDRFGPLPGPGGGLFRAGADPFEETLFGLTDSDERTIRVSLPDDLFDPAKDDLDGGNRTILGLLSGYRFTTQESTPDDQSVDPDPELLGKVFENLYQEDERHKTGAYYTPREIVHYMCRQALDGYLIEQTGVRQEDLDCLRKQAIDWTVSDLPFDPTLAEAISSALDRVTILDPAVGSGAFLVGALQEIVLLRRGLVHAETNQEVATWSLENAEWKRRAITSSLYGVDINPTAVEICRLRLWLSLIIEQEVSSHNDVIPLPDLDFRIVAGDSLVDRMGKDPFIQSLPDPSQSGWQPPLEIAEQVEKLQNEIDELKRKFAGEGAPTASEKRRYVRCIRRAQLKIAQVQLDNAIYWARETVKAREKNPKSTKTALKDATAHLAALERLRAGLREDAPFQKPFLWPVNFHEVFERGGFDIVLANPPYVRQENLDPVDQESYSHSFKGVYSGKADLLLYFYERALQVLREGGQLAFITSNKYMRAAYGKGIREVLPSRLQLREIIDFGDLPLFTVAAYPAVVIGTKCARPDSTAHVRVADMVYPVRNALRDAGQAVNHVNVRQALESLPALLDAASVPAYPQALLKKDGWILEDPRLIRLFERLMSQGTPLGEYVRGRMYRGVLTGLNEAFVIDQATRDALVEADPRSAEVIKPWLRGRDIKRWKAEWAGLYLIAIQNSGDADATNPWANAKDESEARRVFRDTYPAIHDHLSAFESKLRPRKDQGKWWWELRACAYYREFEQPKVIWPRNVPPWEARFAYDTTGAFVNDKGYILGGLSPGAVVYLNSPLVFWLLEKLTTKLQNDWIELKSQEVVGRIPMVGQIPFHDSDPIDDYAIHIKVSEALGVTESEQQLIWEWYQGRSFYRSTGGTISIDD